MKAWMRWQVWLRVIGAAFLGHEFALAATAEEAASALPTGEVLKFSFGTPDSVTRTGFTKVTAADQFTKETGFGFESTEGLLAFDRGGSEIQRPRDEYTARTYGAYRTTSDLTSAFVEGTTDSTFLATVPDGDYTVWLVASDAEWDPPLFEVWANDQKKLEVRIPRARFVFMEPFQAHAAGGLLRISLQGTHGWLLNGLVIGQPGPELEATVETLERDIFFLSEPELPNWTERKVGSDNPPLNWTNEEQDRGYLAFPVDYTEAVSPAFVPARETVGRSLTAFATPGEFEPATFGVIACRDLGRMAVELSDFVADGGKGTISRDCVEVGIVRCWPQRAVDRGGKGEYQVVPERIENPTGRLAHVSLGENRQWWLTVRVPDDAAAGRYRMTLTLRPEEAPSMTLEWRLLVLPFQLARPADRHWGTWWESFPPVGGLRGPERRGRNTADEEARLVRTDLEDFRDHGFDLAIFGYYFGVTENADGSFDYDISKLAKDLDYWKTLGANTPVVIGCEYTFRNLEYRFAEPGKEHVPGTFSSKARQAIVGLIRHIRDEAERRGWPRIYFYPIDEPGNNKTENRMRFAENVLDMVHEVPGCQTITTVGASDIQRLGDRVDVRIYAYGNYNRSRVLEDATLGHPFWYYDNGMFYGHGTLASRSMAGFEFLRSGAEVATAWGFDCTIANPDNDFDGGHKDWNVMFPGVDRPTPTIYWELCREGVDDCRYVATLQEQIGLAKARGDEVLAQRAEAVLKPLLDPEGVPLDRPLAFGRYRWRIAREILALQGDREVGLSFAAVAANPPPADRIGPNLVANSSFEEPVRADGSPPGWYQLGFPELRDDQRGALRVTDEAAHSGRYSLKWDLSQVAKDGPVSQYPRWLVVNVPIPTDITHATRGQRVKVGYWVRMAGGSTVPGLGLRQNLSSGPGEGFYYRSGLDDPAVWNHFETEGRLNRDLESMDIHTWVAVPEAGLARQSGFYLDDFSFQIVEEPPVSVTTDLDEYYVGELIPWSAQTLHNGQLRVSLSSNDRTIAESTGSPADGRFSGTFGSRECEPGVYTLTATIESRPAQPEAGLHRIVLTPDPFEWLPQRP